MPGAGVSLGEHREKIGVAGVGDERLAAVDNPRRAFLFGARLNPDDVRACRCFGHAVAAELTLSIRRSPIQ